ncbi:HdeD family acid-resistance protein [Enterobacillus tribolii]|uniref:Uncharacterized membrane protein HdeD (DUF308 family) n=1 Tax=Enterobacillus tribolii TaxID=1487935 RepID=A0A370R181_9GAMM|nr:HdeD family acid-resistance protein [Enterobacillus tribolii]MBW7982770.1 HdeD family acid-resistance protein [Enterobacillus tribolii]RDK95668.1 uncharacterized membrane protein HdeD (DUF308 family) [Enterobacillus tribolii]
MLNIDRSRLSRLDPGLLRKQRTTLLVLSLLLLLGGIFCLINPLASGAVLSIVVGILFLLSGITLIASMISNRSGNLWPMIAGILMGIAYLVMGYVFVTNPAAGILTLAFFLGVLFLLGGVIRLITGFKLRGVSGSWVQILIGVLDLIIAYLLLSAGPLTSMTMLITFVGIELLFSSFSCFMLAGLFKPRN